MLIAKRDYEAGDVIMSEQPFIYILDSKNRGFFCDSCLQESASLKRCSGCTFVFYCSKECQEKDWNDHHKYKECKVFKKIKEIEDDQVVKEFYILMLPIRIYLTLRGRPELKDKKFDMPDGSKRSFNDTMTNEEHLKNNLSHVGSFLMIFDLLSSVVPGFESQEFLEVFCRVWTNYAGLGIALSMPSQLNNQLIRSHLLYSAFDWKTERTTRQLADCISCSTQC